MVALKLHDLRRRQLLSSCVPRSLNSNSSPTTISKVINETCVTFKIQGREGGKRKLINAKKAVLGELITLPEKSLVSTKPTCKLVSGVVVFCVKPQKNFYQTRSDLK